MCIRDRLVRNAEPEQCRCAERPNNERVLFRLNIVFVAEPVTSIVKDITLSNFDMSIAVGSRHKSRPRIKYERMGVSLVIIIRGYFLCCLQWYFAEGRQLEPL